MVWSKPKTGHGNHGLIGFINHSDWINQFYKPNTGWWFGTNPKLAMENKIIGYSHNIPVYWNCLFFHVFPTIFRYQTHFPLIFPPLIRFSYENHPILSNHIPIIFQFNPTKSIVYIYIIHHSFQFPYLFPYFFPAWRCAAAHMKRWELMRHRRRSISRHTSR